MQPVALWLADSLPTLDAAIARARANRAPWTSALSVPAQQMPASRMPASATLLGLQILVAVLALAALLALVWLLLHWLASRWRDDADALTAEVRATLTTLHSDLAAVRAEAAPYPREIEPPYHALAQHLHTLLDAVATALTLVTRALDTLDAERSLSDHEPLSDRGHLARSASEPSASEQPAPEQPAPPPLFGALRDSHRHRAQLRLLLTQATGQHPSLDEARGLLRDLRRMPLEIAAQARTLLTILDGADRTVATLRDRDVHGERLDSAQGTLQTQRAELAALPPYLLKAKESQISRLAQPAAIARAWQVLSHLDPEVREQASTLECWLGNTTSLDSDLATMRDTVTSADEALARVDPAIDVSDLRARWALARQAAHDLEARCQRPTVEDLDGRTLAHDIVGEAQALIGRLASLEALRTSLVDKLAEGTGLLDEIGRQLRQLGEAGRYPLDRVPFQEELDRLRRQLATVGKLSPDRPRAVAQLESSLATAQGIDQHARALTARLAEAREDRRRLIDLLEPSADRRTAHEVDWFAWAQDLHERTRAYTDATWTATPRSGETDDLRVPALLEDAAALRERWRIWVPEHKDDLLDASTLPRRVREIQAVRADTEAFQNRLDAITRRLQQLQRTEEKARADLEATYAALDRLEIVASGVLPDALSEEENHWSALRQHLSQGYDLDVAFATPTSGTVWEKATQVSTWIAACQTTLNDWHRALQRELDVSSGALVAGLDDLAAIAPLTDEPATRDARNALQAWDMARTRRSEIRRTGPVPDAAAIAGLSDRIADQLRALAQIDQALTALQTTAIAPLADPVRRWREARQSAEAAYRRLQALELQSARLWPPVSCDTVGVKALLDQAETLQGRLKGEGVTVERATALLEDIVARYNHVVAATGEREATYRGLRPHLDIALDRLDAWSDALGAYQKEHEADPAVVAAIRARLDEMQTATTQLQIEWERADTLIPGEDARRALETLWRQAHRDIPVGAGSNVIPVEWLER